MTNPSDDPAQFLPGGETHAKADQADDRLIEEELAYINSMRNGPDREHTAPHIEELLANLRGDGTAGSDDKSEAFKPYLTGLALSGGGIRSATFALGVLQRLARARILEQFDYLSTVSGGGYIGASLTWWLSGPKRTGVDVGYDLGNNFPYGTIDPQKADPNPSPVLQYLRENGRYLIPGNGITIWSGTSIILRAILLNLLVWIPLSGLLLLMLIQLGKVPFFSELPSVVGAATGAALTEISTLLDPDGSVSMDQIFPPFFLLALLLGGFLLLIFAVGAINYSLLAWIERGEGAAQRLVARQRHKLKFVGAQENAVEARETGRRGHRNSVAPWIKVIAVSILDIVILALTWHWLSPLIDPLFSGATFPAEMVGRLWGLSPGTLVLAGSFAAVYYKFSAKTGHSPTNWRGFRNLFIGFAVLFVLDGAIAILFAQNGQVTPLLGRISGVLQFACAIGFVVLANFWIAYSVRHFLQIEGMSIRYAGRRVFEILFGYAIPTFLGLLALGIIPLVDAWIGIEYAGLEGAFSIVIGVGTALWGHLQSRGPGIGGKRTEIVLAVGSGLLVYGILLIGFRLAVSFENGDTTVRAILTALCLIAAIVGWFTNVNYVSLHRYYRDRLMEAFMPDPETVESGVSGPARRADEMRLSDVWDPDGPIGPLPLINTNVVLVNSHVRKFRVRGGDNFILSPVYCGSNATGWQRTDTVIDGELTLATAMATSGAAANPRAAVGGRGVTRNQFLSLAMTLLNFRLGYWVPRPNPEVLIKRRPNHFKPSGWYSVPSIGYAETSSYLELSDGAHFENLGLYELVRRRCGLIVVCDGGSDIQTAYSEFLTATQRIEQDFGATIEFDIKVDKKSGDASRSGPEQLISRPHPTMYPKGAEYADKGYFVATIDYGPRRGGGHWPEKGLLIYLKTTMITDLSMKARGYKGANPDFPDETTADQFFDEEQFEAYREVGYRIADQMISELDLQTLLTNRPLLGALRDNATFRGS